MADDDEVYEFWARVGALSPDGRYQFIQVQPDDGGLWLECGLSGLAYEFNGRTDVPMNAIVTMIFLSHLNEYRFSHGQIR